MIIKSKWLNYIYDKFWLNIYDYKIKMTQLYENFTEQIWRKLKKFKSTHTRTPKSTYMKVQVRTINLNQQKDKKTQNQSINIQDNQEHYEQHGI